MESLGSEVGQKMRSAVKAKLLELGTGGSAGYIDDELPDYVMIMVANKRSKQQMIADLNLFLGSQTDLFVTWLHEVLQKLQEVTLPAAALQKKRKNNQKDEATSSKKDKKEKKKDKKLQNKSVDQGTNEMPSITDVFADEFLEKAKKTFEIDENAVQKSKKQESTNREDETDEFNIPTISEISNQCISTSENREKDLAELAEIQKKIYAAKKQLKILDDVDESEDEDFLNIKEDAEEFDEAADLVREKKKLPKPKSPIVFDKKNEEDNESNISDDTKGESMPIESVVEEQTNSMSSTSRHRPIEYSRRSEPEKDRTQAAKDKTSRKRSIHERLGHMSKDYKASEHSHQHRRAEKELYVPAFRRREMEKEKREKRSNGEHDSRSSRKRSHSPDRNKRDNSTDRTTHQRIGSRVVVAPPKPDISIDDDVDNQQPDRPVNSVIKIKPRPSISPSKQACKNLLLRAVAEAQRSTILVKPKKDISVRKTASNSPSKRNTKFFTKSYRDRINRDTLLRRTAKNLVIEVLADTNQELERHEKDEEIPQEEEYVPEHISDRGESDIELIYIPQTINTANNKDEEVGQHTIVENSVENKTQFVVTLNDKKSSNYKLKAKTSRLNGIERKNRSLISAREKIDIRSRLTLNKDKNLHDRESNSSPSCNTPPRPSSSMSASKKTELIKIYRKPKEVKKIVIKNDSEDEDIQSPKKESLNKIHIPKEEKRFSDSKEKSLSPDMDGSTTPPLPVLKREEKTPEHTPSKRKRQLIKFDLTKQLKVEEPVPAKRRLKSDDREKEHIVETTVDERNTISIRNVESKKYDNLPSSLNCVPIDSLVIKSKPKERCKYYPGCTKDICDFYHPAGPCKSFPNCKYADKCLYVHPKCKFDLTCNRNGCNFQHTTSMAGQGAAPPLSSHVVPVQNYKSISTASAPPSMCKYYPNCSKPSCPFFHPKMCRFGRNCNNKMECNFYHHDAAGNKFKWVASIV